MIGVGLLVVGAGAVAMQPLIQPAASLPEDALAAEYRAAGIGPQSRGGGVGMRMAAGIAVEPLSEIPERPFRDLVATLGDGDRLDASLRRAGVAGPDARAARAAVAAVAPGQLEAGTKVNVRLGRARSDGSRPLERLSLRARYDLQVELERVDERFSVRTAAIEVTAAPVRVTGRVRDGLYWSLRGAGVSPRHASDYIKAIGARFDVGEIVPGDRFDLVMEQKRTAAGEELAGSLLYAGIKRGGRAPLDLMRWSVGGQMKWVDTGGLDGNSQSGMIWPVNAPISSNYGMRRHPILRYNRMHSGIDFAARSGTPIVAAADGKVVSSGWAGGAGRRVKISHDGGIVTSYAHMSRIAVPSGTSVTRGQVIGYVGSSGLSTGPHLHYEVSVGGRKVNPRSVDIVRRNPISGEALKALKGRYQEYQTLEPMAPPSPSV